MDFQLIAANIDVAFIIQSSDYNLRRLERYLVMVNDSGIVPIILLSKCDLVAKHELDEIKKRISSISAGTAVIAFSNVTGDKIDFISDSL